MLTPILPPPAALDRRPISYIKKLICNSRPDVWRSCAWVVLVLSLPGVKLSAQTHPKISIADTGHAAISKSFSSSAPPQTIGTVIPGAQSQNSALTPNSFFNSFIHEWQARVTRTLARQPKWIVPVFAPYPMLVQVYRTEFTRQITPAGVHNWNLGASRGLNLVPFPRTEIDILPPPFLEHGDRTPDGFGDFSFLVKYRLASGNEQHGNYLLSLQTITAFPTGSYTNGGAHPVVSPTLTGGKGWGNFDVQTGVGGTLPTAGTLTTGRTITTNTVAQYHTLKYLWPEVEINSTAWYGGTRDGKVQAFITPGVVFGRVPLPLHGTDKSNRKGIVLAFGLQTALTQYRTYNHALIFSGRYTF